MLRDNIHKSHHYYLKENYILGEKWMDTKGAIWTIDDITESYIVVESVINGKLIERKIDPEDYHDFLHYRIC